MKDQIERMEAIVKVVTARYKGCIPMPYDELLQEGYAAAAIGMTRWRKSQGKAAMIAWGWIYVLSRCKELASKCSSGPEIVSYEEHKNTETFNATELYIDEYFADTDEGEGADPNDSQNKQNAFMFLKSALTNGYDDIVQRFEESISSQEIANREHLTRQRIDQLNRKVEKFYSLTA